jgi:hypothetical protein
MIFKHIPNNKFKHFAKSKILEISNYPILDIYGGATTAISLRRLSTTYTGPCIRIRRLSDNTESDFGFKIDGTLSYEDILDFIGSSVAAVRTVYDQSGNGNNLIQETNANQPFLNVDGRGFHIIRFRESGELQLHFMTFPSGMLFNATSLSYFHYASIINTSNGGFFGPSATFNTGLELLNVSSIQGYIRINGTIRNNNTADAYALWTNGGLHQSTLIGNSTSVAAWRDGSSRTLTSSVAMPTLNYNGLYAIGVYASSFFTSSSLYEMIIYTSDQTANRENIEFNMNQFYNVL